MLLPSPSVALAVRGRLCCTGSALCISVQHDTFLVFYFCCFVSVLISLCLLSSCSVSLLCIPLPLSLSADSIFSHHRKAFPCGCGLPCITSPGLGSEKKLQIKYYLMEEKKREGEFPKVTSRWESLGVLAENTDSWASVQNQIRICRQRSGNLLSLTNKCSNKIYHQWTSPWLCSWTIWRACIKHRWLEPHHQPEGQSVQPSICFLNISGSSAVAGLTRARALAWKPVWKL